MLTFDLRDFQRLARNLKTLESQVPFALANAMTHAAFRTRELLITDTWPRAVEVRNRAFLRRSLRIQKARKTALRVAIVDDLNRDILLIHAQGGTKRPLKRGLAIPPSGTVSRGPRGVPKGERPKAVIARTPKRALRVTSRGIFVGAGGRLHLRYAFAPTATVKPDVPFLDDFEHYMRREIQPAFVKSIRKAMKTARRK